MMGSARTPSRQALGVALRGARASSLGWGGGFLVGYKGGGARFRPLEPFLPGATRQEPSTWRGPFLRGAPGRSSLGFPPRPSLLPPRRPARGSRRAPSKGELGEAGAPGAHRACSAVPAPRGARRGGGSGPRRRPSGLTRQARLAHLGPWRWRRLRSPGAALPCGATRSPPPRGPALRPPEARSRGLWRGRQRTMGGAAIPRARPAGPQSQLSLRSSRLRPRPLPHLPSPSPPPPAPACSDQRDPLRPRGASLPLPLPLPPPLPSPSPPRPHSAPYGTGPSPEETSAPEDQLSPPLELTNNK
ncbi:uncharacterized protein [Notamacropus eugenii]|uniref:uncharacterized protein n=1 Tax=Notamacropus eugenii TaxID=9315 RepID=UPI003B67793D